MVHSPHQLIRPVTTGSYSCHFLAKSIRFPLVIAFADVTTLLLLVIVVTENFSLLWPIFSSFPFLLYHFFEAVVVFDNQLLMMKIGARVVVGYDWNIRLETLTLTLHRI